MLTEFKKINQTSRELLIRGRSHLTEFSQKYRAATLKLYRTYIAPHRLVYVMALSFFFLFFRNTDMLLNPQLWAEDGTFFFRDAFNNGLNSLSIIYAGTFHAFPRIISLIATAISIEYVPLFFSIISIVTVLLPVFIIWSDENILFGKNKIVYLVVFSFLYLLLPMHQETLGSLANTIWYLAISAVLVLIRPSRSKDKWRWFDYTVLLVSGLTGPYVVLMVLPALYLYLKSRDNKGLVKLVIIAACAIVQLTVIVTHPYPQQETFRSQAKTTIREYKRPFQITVMRFVVEPLMQSDYPQLELAHIDQLYVLGVAIIFLYITAMLRAPPRIKALLFFTFSIYAISLFRTGNGKLLDFWEMLQISPLGARYILIPFIGWLVALFVLLGQKNRMKTRYIAYTSIALMVIIFPLSYHMDRIEERHYKHHVKNYNQLEKGQEYCFPENPDGWNMCLVKK